MNKEIFKSDRYFAFWDYNVSHRQLLLRSDKRKGQNENIDIIFYDTSYIQLFTMLYGVSIQLLDKGNIINYKTVEEYLSYDTHNLFEIKSNNEQYYIAAAFVHVFENDFESRESAIGYKNVEDQKRIASSVED